MRRLMLGLILVAFVLLVIPYVPQAVADDDDDDKLEAVPFVFVGKANDCGVNYPAGSRIVTSAWLQGMGLPDNGGPNTTAADLATNPNKRDPHLGLLLSKNGPTADCSAAGARILGVEGHVITATSELGYDIRNGTHCGAGAPRFNLLVRAPGGAQTFHFVGACANDNERGPAPQDPEQWTRTRFQLSDPGEAFPVVPAGSKIVSLSVIHDEGTDNPVAEDPQGDGLAVIDNIFIDGETITRGEGIQPSSGRDRD